MMKIPARIHVLLAKESQQAIIIRRGSSKKTAVIGWNRKDDSFSLGQWFKGNLYPFRSDISPDGRHWIYFAMNHKNQTWTAVAKTPYLKALDFYLKGDAWNGGGLFCSNQSYWLNDSGAVLHLTERQESGLATVKQWNRQENLQGECPLIYFRRLLRYGWGEPQIEQTNKYENLFRFSKPIESNWILEKHYHTGSGHPIGKGFYYESHLLKNISSGLEIPLPDAEWAEIDGNRFLYAQHGQIWSASINKNGLKNETMLLDTNDMEFEERIAPY